MRRTRQHLERAAERRMRVAQANELAEPAHHRGRERALDLLTRVVVPIDVAPDARAREQVHVVRAAEQPDVVDLRNAGQEELDRARCEIRLGVASTGVEVRAVDLIEVEVRGRGAMVALELVKPGTIEPNSDAQAAAIKKCQQEGVLILNAGTYGNVIRLLPPLVITDEQLIEGLEVLEKALSI